jgi:uncharacterized membrane protein YciS (DUF1049 family)
MSTIAYLFWGLLVGIVLLGVLFDKLFPNKVKFNDTEHVKSANQQLNENASLNNKSTNEITGSFIP